ncbi:MAG: hypothetical protein R3A79_28800 [Nannocystaceae bacterium]
MTAKLAVDAVLDRLALGPWRLTGLPTLRGAGLYFVALRPGGSPTFAWFALDRRLSASRTRFFDREGAAAFLREYARDGIDEAMLVPWDENAEPAAATLRSALTRTQASLAELAADPRRLAAAADGGWLERSVDVGWLVTKRYDRGPGRFHCGEERAASELLTLRLRCDPADEPKSPPEGLAAAIDAERRRRAEAFAAHGPAPARLLLRSGEGEPARGFMRFADGVHALVELDADGVLRRAELWPADAAFEQLFRDTKAAPPSRSLALDPRVQTQLAGLRDLDALARSHRDGAVRLRCGKFARGGFATLDADTLLDDLSNHRLPVRAALDRFADGRGFVAVAFEEQVPPSVEARAEDDPDSPNVRYLFPKVWLHRLTRERVFERGFAAALRAACELSREDLERTQEEVDRGEHCGRGRRVTLRAGAAAVVLDEEPIEGGLGVHGESVRASFRGLPPGLQMRGSGRVDMRGGGHLSLKTDADDLAVALRIKRAVLDALP